MSSMCSVCKRGMRTIQDLPTEIYGLIFSYLEGRDLKSARLACKTLQREAAPFLFTTAYIAARRGVLNNFTALAEHPVLSTYVTEVIYDSSWFEEWDDGPPTESEKNPRFLPLKKTAEHRQKYIENFAEQEHIQKEELCPILARAFKSLTKVQRVVYADLWRLPCLHGDRLEELGPDFRFGRYDSPLISQHKLKLKIPWCAEVPDDQVFRRQNMGLYVLLRALSSPQVTSKLTELSIGNGAYSSGAPFIGVPQLLLLPMAESLSKNESSFSYLRKLEVSFGLYWVIDHEDQFPLGRIIGYLHHLEDLRIAGPVLPSEHFPVAVSLSMNTSANPQKSGFGPGASLANLLGQNTWSRLSHLELHWLESDLSSLVDFFNRQNSTLKYVNLFNIIIWNSSSREKLIRFFRSLRPGTVVELGLDNEKSFSRLELEYILYDGEAQLILRGPGLDDDYDEDQVSSYSSNDNFSQEEERGSSEELEFSDNFDDYSDIDNSFL
ncbi:MAG: hypothetical protein LQ351_006423 [Letrouitia transgressa]|nr:MAG: hypothetical protein LQ351_006423 [Letrouitia transgressa]